MQIEHIEETKQSGYFSAAEHTAEAGRITYVISADSELTIDHTEVSPAYEGHGLGKKLVLAVVDYARAHKLKVLPACSFAKALFDKTPEIQDVLF